MKLIYCYSKQKISYEGGNDEYSYYQCDSMEEYKKCVAQALDKKENYIKRGYGGYISVHVDDTITAREYHSPGVGWTGRIFDAEGLYVWTNDERNHCKHVYYIKPNTLVEQAKPKREYSFMDSLTDS